MDRSRSTLDADEVARFAAMADEWWNPRGKMAPLHRFNPARIAFIRDAACGHFGRDARRLDCLDALRILDVGCGGGLLAEPLARLGGRVTAIDPAEENIAAARAHADQSGLNIDYRAATIEALADARESFDLVIASEVVEHVTDVPLFVRTCAEVVGAGGMLAMTTINRTAKSFALVIVGAEYLLRWLPVGTHQWDRFVDPDELERAMKSCGLEIADETGFMYNPLSGGWRSSSDMDVNYGMIARRNIVLAGGAG